MATAGSRAATLAAVQVGERVSACDLESGAQEWTHGDAILQRDGGDRVRLDELGRCK